jgi:hypothetical protein
LFQVVIACNINQSRSHWLLNDALNFFITMSFKLKEEVGITLVIDQLMDDDFGIALEIFLIDFNIKKSRVVCLTFSFHF